MTVCAKLPKKCHALNVEKCDRCRSLDRKCIMQTQDSKLFCDTDTYIKVLEVYFLHTLLSFSVTGVIGWLGKRKGWKLAVESVIGDWEWRLCLYTKHFWMLTYWCWELLDLHILSYKLRCDVSVYFIVKWIWQETSFYIRYYSCAKMAVFFFCLW